MGRNCSDMAKVTKARIVEATRDLAKRVAKERADFLAEQPDGHLLSVTVKAHVNGKRPAGFLQEMNQMVQSMAISAEYRKMTNGQIVAKLRTRFPNHAVSDSIMYAAFKPYQKTAITSMLTSLGKQIDLNRNNTLSKVKAALKGDGAYQKAKQHRVFELRFSFSDKEVVVGDKCHKITITNGGLARIRVDGQWINANTLEKLISAA